MEPHIIRVLKLANVNALIYTVYDTVNEIRNHSIPTTIQLRLHHATKDPKMVRCPGFKRRESAVCYKFCGHGKSASCRVLGTT